MVEERVELIDVKIWTERKKKALGFGEGVFRDARPTCPSCLKGFAGDSGVGKNHPKI